MSATESLDYLTLEDFRAKFNEFVSFYKKNCKYYIYQEITIKFLDLILVCDTFQSFVEKTYNFDTDLYVTIKLSQMNKDISIDIEYSSPLYSGTMKIRNTIDRIDLYIKGCSEDNISRYCITDIHNNLCFITIVENKTDTEDMFVEYKYIKYLRYEDSKHNEYFKIIYNWMSKIISLNSSVGSYTKGAIRF
jgi:hypothetical protein